MQKKIRTILFFLIIFCSLAAIFLYVKSAAISAFYYTVKEHYMTYEMEQLVVHVEPSIPINERAIKQAIDDTERLGESLFTVTQPKKPVTIFITLSGKRAYDAQLNEQTMGAYLPRQSMILINGHYTSEISSTIIHEYSHYLMHLYLEEHATKIDRVPEWFREGLAYDFEFSLTNQIPFKDSYYFTALPFQQLEKANALNKETLYKQGFYAITNLKASYGTTILKDLLEEMTTSNFEEAWEGLIAEPLATYDERFELQNSIIKKLENRNLSAAEIIHFVTQLDEAYGPINVYTPYSSPPLIDAYSELKQWDFAKMAIEKYEPFIANPGEYIELAKLVKEERSYSEALLERGRQFAIQYEFDLQVYDKESQSVFN